MNSREPAAADGDRIHKKTERLSSCGRAKEREKAQIISELRQRYPLKDLLQISGMARSTYYYYQKHSKSDKYESVKQEIVKIFNEHKGRYGYRRVLVVMRNNGSRINHKTVQKLMKELGLKGKQRKNNQYHSYKGTVGKVADNILARDFHADKPFEKITTDVTQFNVCDDKVYLSPIMDLFNREIVSYSISLSPNLQQIREMLDGLFVKLPEDAKPLFHSDQGWQYQHAEYQRLLAEHNITQSMSRKGNCMDNGAMENFFGRLKVEMFYGEKFESVNAFIDELIRYIDYYNNERISTKLKGMSPVQFRTHSLSI
ncbi:MAG: IS3 family transposase [Clostridia bacterium]|nr:IS3 family transposase [Clostridia bacterium]